MKNYIKTSLMILMFLLAGYGFSQKTNTQTLQEFDRDVTFKQQLAIIQAGKDNPAKAPLIENDARMSEEFVYSPEAFGPANQFAQPVEGIDREPVDPPASVNSSQNTANTIGNSSSNTQPQPAPNKNVVNYRNLSGKGSQPAPVKSENTVNYRNIQGNSEQPEGKPSDK
jgi:hypothetical protein